MPLSINGIGTGVCPARGSIRWPGLKSPDCDAMECFVLLHMPVIPYKPIHTYDWKGNKYRAIPIRASRSLVLRAMSRSWLGILPLIVAVVPFLCLLVFIFAPPAADRSGLAVSMVLMLLVTLGISLGTFQWLKKSDQRNLAIRRALGRHQLGSSDPADWNAELARAVQPGKERASKLSYADSARRALAVGKFSAAMWDARFACLVEDRVQSEQLTDEILADLGFREALERIGKHGEGWAEAMNVEQSRDASAQKQDG